MIDGTPARLETLIWIIREKPVASGVFLEVDGGADAEGEGDGGGDHHHVEGAGDGGEDARIGGFAGGEGGEEPGVDEEVDDPGNDHDRRDQQGGLTHPLRPEPAGCEDPERHEDADHQQADELEARRLAEQLEEVAAGPVDAHGFGVLDEVSGLEADVEDVDEDRGRRNHDQTNRPFGDVCQARNEGPDQTGADEGQDDRDRQGPDHPTHALGGWQIGDDAAAARFSLDGGAVGEEAGGTVDGDLDHQRGRA